MHASHALLALSLFSCPVLAQDWQSIAAPGMGAASAYAAWPAATYDGALFAVLDDDAVGAGVWRHDGLAWTQVAPDGFGKPQNTNASPVGAVFDGRLYLSTENDAQGCELWAYDGAAWSLHGAGGFGDPANQGAYFLATFDDALYVGTENFATGCEVWRFDGASLAQVNADGFGSSDNEGAFGLCVHAGALFVGTSNFATGGEVWRYDGAQWSQQNQGGFGDPHNWIVTGLASVGADLYATTVNVLDGAEVWRLSAGTWTQVNTNGFGDAGNEGALSVVAYRGGVAVSTLNGATGAEVWTLDGGAWSQRNADGFGSSANESAGLRVHADLLHAGTENGLHGGELWRFGADVGASYCGPAEPNSTGMPGVMLAQGSDAVADNALTLRGVSLPPDRFAYFLTSETQGFVQHPGGSQGNLCLGGEIGRYNRPAEILSTGPAGAVHLSVDLTDTPQPTGRVAILAGETWSFQLWYRDKNPTTTSNFTDGVAVAFH